MAIKKSELYSSLWKSCDELRGGMNAREDVAERIGRQIHCVNRDTISARLWAFRRFSLGSQ